MSLPNDFCHANPSPELQKLESSKCFGEDVGKLIVGADVVDVDPTFFHTLTNEVVSYLNVFASIMEDGVLGERDC